MNNETGSIKNILFDLGGVIMDLKRERCVEALTKLGMTGANELLGLYVQVGPFLKLEEGLMSPAEFRDAIRANIATEVTDAQIDAAFNMFLVGIPVHRLESIRKLKEKYKIYMLSNTNAIMFNSKIAECFKVEGRTINDYFDGLSLSYEAKSAKPDPEIFKYTIEKLGINAHETLFFDDSQKNLDAAAQFGFKTHLVSPGTEFMDYFNV